MEFEEVNEFLKHQKVNDPTLSATSLDLQLAHRPDPYESSLFYHHNYAPIRKRHAVPGVSRLVNSVRRLKRSHRSRVEQGWNELTTSDEDNYYLHDDTRHIFPDGTDKSHTETPKTNTSLLPRATRRKKGEPNLIKGDLGTNGRPHAGERLAVFHPQRRRRRSSSVPCITFADVQRIDEQIQEVMPHQVEPKAPTNNEISATDLIDRLTEDVQQYQYLVQHEEQRIEVNRRDIADYIEKLKLLDEDVQYLNATIRLDKIKAMISTLQETNQRNVMLTDARTLQKRTTTTIEGYSKSTNYVARLNGLQAKMHLLRKREAIWSWFRNWGLAFGKD
ncbi:hypothetical protein DFQ28_003068 [Apophysomyces sp. BC1034]|nr:hypothetical protein DFQ29_002288 [Apophysomyces sp. BC1021]KAG0189706.1 hypothetical protein DFQ28_003068 [Apophysomyces sp. BC1034]